ncbi:MAG: UbiX family flavin prenyltransferase [Methanomicrobiales archaeon]|nr:UbiX family flavin prenyltransferase [Methanomicrobiales archaeon]
MGKEFVVGVTGASGIIYARRLLDVLGESARVHLIISEVAREIASFEDVNLDGCRAVYHDVRRMEASFASGSFRHNGMVIIPCSMKTLSSLAHGNADNLITRAADVTLKERRPCLLVLREMPFNRVHLENMLSAHDAGATVMVASPGFYHHPKTITDLVDMVVARVLDHLQVEHNLDVRWEGA